MSYKPARKAKHADRRRSLILKLKTLPPIQFENLVFDLLVLSGLRNATWRTPGPDAGRDIEGHFVSTDLSETLNVEKWYVECKRYKQSLDWPAVYNKIAYADNHGADFLLFVTTATLSPRCKEELASRENRKSRPSVRVWDAPVLENVVARHSLLLVKYGLTRDLRHVPRSILPLITVASKVVQAAYGRAVLAGSLDRALECAAALVDLVSARTVELDTDTLIRPRRFVLERDRYEWCSLAGDLDLQRYDGMVSELY